MPREIAVFDALVPTLLPIFLGSILIFVVIDQILDRTGAYRLVWHPPLVRLALFTGLFSALGLYSFS